MNPHDIKNQKFGMLTAIEYVKGGNGKKAKWHCLCDCGNYRDVDTNTLMRGDAVSCGCQSNGHGKFADITGNKYGRWTVLSYSHSKGNGYTYYLCRCECGTEKPVTRLSLVNGTSVSCGCYHKEAITKHPERNPKLYSIWHNMKDRCYREKHPAYKRYGGRGVRVCDEWLHDYTVFHEWALANGYKAGLSLDRIDNDSSYSPDNCRWATMKEQANNKHVRNQYST